MENTKLRHPVTIQNVKKNIAERLSSGWYKLKLSFMFMSIPSFQPAVLTFPDGLLFATNSRDVINSQIVLKVPSHPGHGNSK